MLRSLIEQRRVDFYEGFDHWEDAVRACCRTLLADATITGEYVDAIIQNIYNFGPYIVILPGIAIPHAKIDVRGVNACGISMTLTRRPVSFAPGNPDKDVTVFFTLAANDMDEHYKNMEQLSELLMCEALLEELKAAGTLEETLRLSDKYGM